MACLLFGVDLFDAYLEHSLAGAPWDMGQLVSVSICIVLVTSCLIFRRRWLDVVFALAYHVAVWGWLYSLVDYGVLTAG